MDVFPNLGRYYSALVEFAICKQLHRVERDFRDANCTKRGAGASPAIYTAMSFFGAIALLVSIIFARITKPKG